MYAITNTNGQLKLTYSNFVEYYEFPTFKSISSGFDTVKGNYYVIINFIANDKNNSLRLYLVDISNQGSWTNNANGAIQAVNDISSWSGLSSAAILPDVKQPGIIRSSGNALTYIPSNLSSISFASTGTSDATIVVNGTSMILKPGETISYDAGAINNYMTAYNFAYDTSLAGSELLIIFIYQ
jgi:hypothetical protein